MSNSSLPRLVPRQKSQTPESFVNQTKVRGPGVTAKVSELPKQPQLKDPLPTQPPAEHSSVERTATKTKSSRVGPRRVRHERAEPVPKTGLAGDLWKDLAPLYRRTGWPIFLKLTKPPLRDLVRYEAKKLRDHSAHETMTCVELNDKGGSAKSVTNAENLTTFALATQQPSFGIDFDAKRSGNLLSLLGMPSGTLSVEDLLADPSSLSSWPNMLKPPNGGTIGQHDADGLRGVRAIRFSHLPPEITGGSRYEGSVQNDEFDFDSALEVQSAPADYAYIDTDEARMEPPKEQIEDLVRSAQMLNPYVGIDLGNALYSRWLRVGVEMSDICDISIVPTVQSSEESGANTLNTLRLMYPDISRRCTITAHGYKGAKPMELAESYARIYRLPIGHISIVPYDEFFVNKSDGADVRTKIVVDPREIRLRTLYVTLQRLNRQFEIKKAFRSYLASQAQNIADPTSGRLSDEAQPGFQ